MNREHIVSSIMRALGVSISFHSLLSTIGKRVLDSVSRMRLTFYVYHRMNRRKADFKFAYKFLEDDL